MNRLTRSLLVVGVFTALGLAGCVSTSTWAYPHAGRETLAESPQEHRQRISAILAHDRRALAEDLDLFFMTDRQGRLTRWHGR